jgi:hypothetical protein
MNALIQLGQTERDRQAAQAQAAQKQNDALEQKEAAIIQTAHLLICQALANETGLAPADFEPVVTLVPSATFSYPFLVNNADEAVTLRAGDITIALPQHNAIYATFEIDQETDTYHRHSNHYSIENCDDLYNRYGEACKTLPHAIMIAAYRWQAEEKYRQREDARQRELEQLELADHQREQTERQTLLTALSDDPITLAILKLHAAIQSERTHYRQSIEELDHHLEQSTQRAHDRAQAHKRELQSALDELDYQRQRAYATEDKLDQQKR